MRIKYSLIFLVFSTYSLWAQLISPAMQRVLDQFDGKSVETDLEAFVAFGQKTTGTQACHDAGNWLMQKHKTFGADSVYAVAVVDFSTQLSPFPIDSFNTIIALKRGRSAPDSFIVVSAHYDTKNSTGANDNGSGTVALLSAARLLEKVSTYYSVMFVHFAGEEQGLVGSEHFVQNHLPSLQNQCVVVMNIDMIGGQKGKDNSEKDFAYPQLASYQLRKHIEPYCDTMVQIAQNYSSVSGKTVQAAGLSDTEAFGKAGVAAFGMHMGYFPTNIHSPQDNLQNLDIPATIDAVHLATACILYLAKIVEEVVVLRPNRATNMPAPFRRKPISGEYVSLNGRQVDKRNTTAIQPIIQINSTVKAASLRLQFNRD